MGEMKNLKTAVHKVRIEDVFFWEVSKILFLQKQLTRSIPSLLTYTPLRQDLKAALRGRARVRTEGSAILCPISSKRDRASFSTSAGAWPLSAATWKGAGCNWNSTVELAAMRD